MKKILFLIQTFPAKRSANVICDTKIISELRKSGAWEIHCLTYRLPWQTSKEFFDGVYVHRFNRTWWWNVLMKALETPQSRYSRLIQKLDRLRLRLSQLLFACIYPNEEPLLYRKFSNEALRICGQIKFDIVIAEHYGGDTLFAGAKVKSHYPNIKLMSILWDPISGRTLPKYLPQKYAERKNLEFEERILRYSDLIVGMRAHMPYQQVHSSEKSFFRNVIFLDIPGIIRPETQMGNNRFVIKGKINVIFTGVLNLPDRDPSLVIKTFGRSKYKDNFNLMFFAVGGGSYLVESLIKNEGLQGFVHAFIPRSELNSVLQTSDILLNIGGPNTTQVPSKIFEYMSYGKPIVSTYYVDNESSLSYFQRYPLALCLDLRKGINENASMLDELIDSKLGQVLDFTAVEKLYPLNNPQTFVCEIEKLCSL